LSLILSGVATAQEDFEGPLGVCVTVVAQEPPDEWSVEALLGGLDDGSVVIVGAANPAACADYADEEGAGAAAVTADGAEQWQTIRSSFLADKYKWDPRLIDLMGASYMKAEKLRSIRAALRKEAAKLKEVGSQPCYADAYQWLVDGLDLVDQGIGHVLEGRKAYGEAEVVDGLDPLIGYVAGPEFFESEYVECDLS
jgi:hypothetical protein